MGIFSALKKLTGFEDQAEQIDSVSKGSCVVKVKIDASDFIMLAKNYYVGHTSYKAFFKNAFSSNPKITLEVMEKAKELAIKGCAIESTYVIFYVDSQQYLEIPFDVYSDKRDMPIYMRNTRTWNKNNLLRILKLFPDFKKYDSELISEMFKKK